MKKGNDFKWVEKQTIIVKSNVVRFKPLRQKYEIHFKCETQVFLKGMAKCQVRSIIVALEVHMSDRPCIFCLVS